MFNETQIEKLKSNWGARAEALACYAEVRLFDPSSAWQCYLLAMNPDNTDEVNCMISANSKVSPEISNWSLQEIFSLYNSEGEGVKIDEDYRPRRAAELFKKLSELIIYDPNRD